MSITCDGTSTGGGLTGTNTLSHTISNKSNRYLFVLTPGDSTQGNTPTAVTYNGVSLSNLYDYIPSGGTFANNCQRIRVWGLANPDIGTHDIISSGATAVSYLSGVSYTGVSSSQPLNINASATVGGQVTTLTSGITVDANDWMISFMAGTNSTYSLIADTAATPTIVTRATSPSYTFNTTIFDTGTTGSGATYLAGKFSSGSGFISYIAFDLLRYKGISITGSNSGNINATANFTITPSESMSGSVTITPSGPGATGLSATILYFTSATPQTYTIAPTTQGLVTLTVTNSAGFQNEGPFYYTVNTPTVHNATVLTIAGGGSGGSENGGNNAGGGGAGGLIVSTESLAEGTYVIPAIGVGASGVGINSYGQSGSNTTAFNNTAIGGGAGAYGSSAGQVGGSGGGSAGNVSGPSIPGALGVSGQGNAGGAGAAYGYGGGGGGGGYGSAGAQNSHGTGYTSSITGTSVDYAAGGGTAISTYNSAGYGSGSSGANSTSSQNAKNGAVIISYPTASTITATGGTKTTVSSNTVHTFTSAGNLVVTTEPGIPTIGTAVPGNTTASVAFTASGSNGGSAITGYTVTSTPGSLTSSGASSPLTVTGLTNGVSYTFTAKATNANGSSNNSSASNAVVPYVPASSFTFTGPTSGSVRSASTNFTVTPNSTYLGSITITPTGVGSTGLSPVTLTWTLTSEAQTFTITPLASGDITLTCTNSNGISNASPLTYTAAAVVPLAPGIGIAQPSTGSARVECTAPTNDGGAAITLYTATSTPGSITGTKATAGIIDVQGLTNGVSYTFTVTATNSVGTSASSSASNAVIPSLSSTNFTNGGPKFNIERNVGNILSF